MTSKSQTATPRTDAFVSRASCKGSKVTDDFSKKELADFARTLETELQQLRLAADGMAKAVKELLTFHPEDAESGAELPRECWTPKYAQAVDGVTDSLARYRALAGEGKDL